MSIIKINSLAYRREFPSLLSGVNDSELIEFDEVGIMIGYDHITWDQIIEAYRMVKGGKSEKT